MTTNESDTGLAGGEQARAAARSDAYRQFALAMAYPDTKLCKSVRAGELRDRLRNCLATIAPELRPDEADERALASAQNGDELAVEFTRLFDVGASGPPCPLYGGLYAGDRMKTMEEALRFYNHFGLTLAEGPRELPDHISTQLEFLHYLAFREAEALQAGSDAGPYQRAQRDFITRQLGAWVPKLRERLGREKAFAYYLVVLASLGDLLAWDAARLMDSPPKPAN